MCSSKVAIDCAVHWAFTQAASPGLTLKRSAGIGGTFHPTPSVWACRRICCASSGGSRSNTHSPSSGTNASRYTSARIRSRNSISDASDNVAAVRVPAENYVRKILPSKQVDNIRDMSRKINSGRVEVRPITKTRKSRRKHMVAGVPKTPTYSLPTPATVPRSMHKNISALVRPFLFVRSCQLTNLLLSSG
jgi:hypothetical protein